MKKILIIEDDISLGKSILSLIKNEGFETLLVTNLKDANEVNLIDYDLIVLDWMLPDGQGIDFLKSIRSENIICPVILLTARVELIDKIIGLESGANDYMTKPFEPRELIARIRVQMRENKTNSENKNDEEIVIINDIELNILTRVISLNKKVIEFTKMEFDLLYLLLSAPGRVFSREEILNKVWGYDNYPSTRTVDTHILQLRQKLPSEYFETVRGVGYKFIKLQ